MGMLRKVKEVWKKNCYDEVKGEWDLHIVGDLAMCLGDLDGHVCRHIDKFDGWYGVVLINMEGRKLLEFCMEKELCVTNEWSKRGKEEGDIETGRK